ncbi:MAG: hypothetical protein IKG14_04105 [Clostridia bacterium]|nr:hypothetical protein [Clostridia bacterium]
MDNKDDGITLIALIVTIIVLIIISGVTIKKLTEDDEFIEEFVNETQYHEEATENEQRKINQVTQNQLEDWGF